MPISALGVAVSICFFSSSFALSATTKIDPVLSLMLQRGPSRLNKGHGILKSAPGAREPFVKTIIRFEGSLSGVESLGGKIGSIIGDIATADIPVSAVDPISKLPNIVYIEAAKRVKPQLDASVPQTGAGALRSGTPPQWTGNTGRNVIIGIVDSGIDLTHADFKDSSGKTRVLSLWDQRAMTGTPPPEFSFGDECSKAIIDAGTCSETDPNGHGTHVAGIAAGNGAATGNGLPPFRYVGMAPEADLIVVRTDYSDAGLLDGISYIQTRAAALGKPSVVNLSLGGVIGSHDGTSNYERGLDRASGVGKVIVVSAGNAADDNIHATGSVVQSGSVTVRFTMPAGTGEVVLDFWYPGVDQMGVSIGNGGCSTPVVNPGNIASFDLSCGLIDVYSTEVQSANQDREIYLFLGGGTNMLNPGSWTVTLSGIDIKNGRFDGWISADTQAEFNTNIDSGITLTESASATKPISVAAYITKNSWDSQSGPWFFPNTTVGNITSFSSRGPRRPCSDISKCPTVQKPELAAPGEIVFSALSANVPSPDPTYRDPDGVHVGYEGTSMAAPHVTGAVALLLQAVPALTSDQIKSILTSHTMIDSFTVSVPNNGWGYGKLNVQAAFAVTPNSPPAAPSGLSAAVGSGEITLNWTANRELDLDGYHLYRSTTPGGGYNKIASIPYQATSYTDTALTNGATYYYVLRAVDTKGQVSVNSAEVSNLPAEPLPAPSGNDSSGGRGCAIGFGAEIDPMLAVILVIGLIGLAWRGVRRHPLC